MTSLNAQRSGKWEMRQRPLHLALIWNAQSIKQDISFQVRSIREAQSRQRCWRCIAPSV